MLLALSLLLAQSATAPNWAVQVIKVEPKSFAAEVGMRPGAVIESYHGHPIKTPFELSIREENVRADERVTVVWWQGGMRKTNTFGVGRLGASVLPALAPESLTAYQSAVALAQRRRYAEASEVIEQVVSREPRVVSKAWLIAEQARHKGDAFEFGIAGGLFGKASEIFVEEGQLGSAIHTFIMCQVTNASSSSIDAVGALILPSLSLGIELSANNLRGFHALLESAKGIHGKKELLPAAILDLKKYPLLAGDLAMLEFAFECLKPNNVQGVLAGMRSFPIVRQPTIGVILPLMLFFFSPNKEGIEPKDYATWFLRTFRDADNATFLCGLSATLGLVSVSVTPANGPRSIADISEITSLVGERFPNSYPHAVTLYLNGMFRAMSGDPSAGEDSLLKAAEITDSLAKDVSFALTTTEMLNMLYNQLSLISFIRGSAFDATRYLSKRPEPKELRLQIMSRYTEAVVLQLSGRRLDAQHVLQDADAKFSKYPAPDGTISDLKRISTLLVRPNPELYKPEYFGQASNIFTRAGTLLVSGNITPGLEQDFEKFLNETPREHLHREFSLTVLARLAILRNDYDTALKRATEAFELFERHRNSISTPADRQEIARFAATMAPVTLMQALLALDRPAEALEVLERTRALALAEAMLVDGGIERRDEPVVAYENLQRERRRTSDQLSLADVDERIELSKKLDEVIAQERLALQAIRVSHNRYGQLGFPNPITRNEVTSLLGTSDILAATIVCDDELWAVFADQSRVWAHRTKMKADELSRIVDTFSGYCAASFTTEMSESDRKDAELLYDALLGPIHDQLVPGKRLLLIADPKLDHLPFAALPSRGKHLIERVPIRYIPSLTVLKVSRERAANRKPGTKWVIAADPSYREVVEGRKSLLDGSRAFDRLPSTRLTADRLTSTLKRRGLTPELMLGAKASPSQILNHWAHTGVLHVGCHGENDIDRPLLSGIFLSPEIGNPSGSLRAMDLLSTSIPADLVVLSSCQVGAGAVLEGEGIDGLTRTLLFAGAKSIVGATRVVLDLPTGELLDLFYADVLKGKRIDEALQAAQVTMLKRRDMALGNWSSFRVIGEGSALDSGLIGR